MVEHSSRSAIDPAPRYLREPQGRDLKKVPRFDPKSLRMLGSGLYGVGVVVSFFMLDAMMRREPDWFAVALAAIAIACFMSGRIFSDTPD